MQLLSYLQFFLGIYKCMYMYEKILYISGREIVASLAFLLKYLAVWLKLEFSV